MANSDYEYIILFDISKWKHDKLALNNELTQDTWACMALGCKGCEALELFGLCWDDLAPTILVSLFRGFAQTMHLSIHAVKTWFEILGFSFPPPGGYGLTTEQLNGIFTEKAAEIQAFFETM